LALAFAIVHVALLIRHPMVVILILVILVIIVIYCPRFRDRFRPLHGSLTPRLAVQSFLTWRPT
jgi:4-hydroxybenzoate polyprenyltransferase